MSPQTLSALMRICSSDSSPVLVLVGGNATTKVTEKAEAPVLVKQVRSDGDWSDFAVAGNDIDPEYRLVGTLPKTYDSLPVYHYEFDDVMDQSLTLDRSSIKVVAASADGKTTKDLTSIAEITLSGQKLRVFLISASSTLSRSPIPYISIRLPRLASFTRTRTMQRLPIRRSRQRLFLTVCRMPP